MLHALSNTGTELLSSKASKKYDLGAVSTTKKALDSFIDDSLIERIEDKYTFSDPFFRMFINRNI